ncbi:spore protease YyaC [Alteribacter populi]|uniref:spore protease YyaC n=1 Tax=Alteribacter populi TaxID=2011011 RepID=UPI000BBAA585|nr:spore protease YyaC [Alteribacter populi]
MFRGQLFQNRRPSPYRIYAKDSNAALELSMHLKEILAAKRSRDLVIVCIGSDRSTGDSLGPLIGTKLQENLASHYKVYGTLAKPVHAVNLQETLDEINATYYEPLILAIDACLGRSTSVGYVCLGEGPLRPGTAVKKQLPAVGDFHMTGIVNVGGFMEMMVLQNTRLSVVVEMADVMSDSIVRATKEIESSRKKFTWPTLPSSKSQ